MTETDRSKDRFELRVLFKADTLAGWDEARPVLEALLAAGGGLVPTELRESPSKGKPLTPEAVERLFGGKKPPREIFLRNEEGVAWEWTGINPRKDPGSSLLIRIPFPLLAGADAGERVVALAEAVCRASRAAYGWGHSDEDLRLGNDPKRTNPWAPRELAEVYWLTILGPEMVKKLGRGKVESTPAHRVEVLDDGTALIVLTPDPSALLSREAREAQAAALAHLRGGTAEEILPSLLERSAKLAPLEESAGEPHPDLAYLYRRIAEAVPLARRRETEQALRARPVPPVTEWRPAAEALPADVDDVEAAVAKYEDQGETFVIGKHTEIPGLEDDEPDSLPAVDAHFHLRDYLKSSDAETLERLMLPTLGAHLGNLLVRFLDGEWVPRRKLEESQVIVGDRAWLPFLRVKHFLASKDAAIDSSLARFYREAERHANGSA
ncbi:MAG TPA: hypothetical protein VFR81_01795 [Longimicrobium sp.]|nr:hypothetical protein [Longimicrobium sp.]